MYIKLSTHEYDRAAALLYTSVSKELRSMQTCENHFEESDLRRIFGDLNDLWLRHVEIAERDLLQIGCADAPRILSKAIEKVRIGADSLT